MRFVFYRLLALCLLVLTSPLLLVLFVLVKLDSKGPFIFKQRRVGKDKKPFFIYKIRTMVTTAEKLKSKIAHLNEADGPVFKIRNDPRYTRVGKFLSHTGLDELPQLLNIVKGEMSFVGPRPFPPEEAEKIPLKYQKRFLVLPGMTSSWILQGAHKLNFKQWMQLDLEYVAKQNIFLDLKIFISTLFFIIKLIVQKIIGHENKNS